MTVCHGGTRFVANFRRTRRLPPAPSLGTRERGLKMPDVAARSASKTSNQRKPRKCSEAQSALDLRYGEIGISAVAAAARYQSGARNPGHPPVIVELDDRGAAVA